jgi:hypothetical protein
MAKIEFESWSAMSDGISKEIAEYRNFMSIQWRLWELCIARANNFGHAAFRPGELVRLACGSDTRSDRQAVYGGLRKLGAMRRIDAHRSTLICVILNHSLVMRFGKGSRKDMCSEPAHMDYRDQPWAPEMTDSPRFFAPEGDPYDDDYAFETSQEAAQEDVKKSPRAWRDAWE